MLVICFENESIRFRADRLDIPCWLQAVDFEAKFALQDARREGSRPLSWQIILGGGGYWTEHEDGRTNRPVAPRLGIIAAMSQAWQSIGETGAGTEIHRNLPAPCKHECYTNSQ